MPTLCKIMRSISKKGGEKRKKDKDKRQVFYLLKLLSKSAREGKLGALRQGEEM